MTRPPRDLRQFQSQGRFFGGCCGRRGRRGFCRSRVSIAGAILWGVLRVMVGRLRLLPDVSIAGAILWGVLLFIGFQFFVWLRVSIAGAILWGVLPGRRTRQGCQIAQFQSQGRFFGGCCSDGCVVPTGAYRFQSQGRFFGGCCVALHSDQRPSDMFQSQGRFFGGCCSASLR